MKIYSEVTKKWYDISEIEKCRAEEKEFKEKELKVQEQKEKLAKERGERAKKVEDARIAYEKELNEFLKDYGTYHYKMIYRDPFNIFNEFFKIF